MRASEFVVIGGGTVGAAVSYGLARAGAAVTLLDEGDIAFRAARGNFGNVWVLGKGATEPAYADLSRRTANDWQSFAATLESETGIDLHYRRPGGCFICLTEAELTQRATMLEELNRKASVKSRFEVLSRDEIAKRLPAVGPDVVGAIYSPDDGSANPLYLLRALMTALIKFGGRYRSHNRVSSVKREGGGFRIDTDGGPVHCGSVLFCCGLGNAMLAPQLGLCAPVRPVRGQILVTEKVKPFLPFGVSFIRQTDEGGCLFGESSEEAGFDDATTLPVLRDNARRAVTVFPLLRDLRVVRSWSALRIMTPDGVPVYDQTHETPRAYALSVHSGVTLAPFHAGAMARAIRDGGLDQNLVAPFSPKRFDVQAA